LWNFGRLGVKIRKEKKKITEIKWKIYLEHLWPRLEISPRRFRHYPESYYLVINQRYRKKKRDWYTFLFFYFLKKKHDFFLIWKTPFHFLTIFMNILVQIKFVVTLPVLIIKDNSILCFENQTNQFNYNLSNII
jgi:hypothetical protein